MKDYEEHHDFLQQHQSQIEMIVFNDQSTKMAVASHDENISYYDVARKELIYVFEGHFQTINSICFHPYYDFLLSGSQDCSLRVWDLEASSSLKFVNSHQKYVTSVAFDLKG
jgi:WD40 repeat protein